LEARDGKGAIRQRKSVLLDRIPQKIHFTRFTALTAEPSALALPNRCKVPYRASKPEEAAAKSLSPARKTTSTMKLYVVAVYAALSSIVFFAPVAVTAFFSDPDNGCAAGEAAGGLVDIANSQLIPFDESGVVFTINGQTVTASNQILLEVNGDYDFAIVQDTSPFVGGLIRVQQGDATSGEPTFTFVPSDTPKKPDSQLDAVCDSSPGVIGVTTLDTETEKSSLTGRFVSTSTTDPVTVDVTVVLTNTTNGALTYTYTQFELRTTVPETTSNNTTETAPGPSPTETLEPTTTRPPTSSPAPTFEEECIICGDANLVVTNLQATVVVNNVNASCAVIVQIGQQRLIPPGAQCDETIAAVLENCECAPALNNATNTTETMVPSGNGTNETLVPTGGNETEAPGGGNETMVPNTNETMVPTNETMVPNSNETMVPTNETMVPNSNETETPGMGNETEVPSMMNETLPPNTTDTNNTDTNETVTPDQEPAPAPPTTTAAAPPTRSRDISSATSFPKTATMLLLLVGASLTSFLGSTWFM
jgi:hypothetical protein